ncbi:HepT-like ribonuclease domain-containing protein [Nautilia sp.]
MFRDLSLYIIDILIATDKINRYTKKILNVEDLISNEIILDAVIRELIIIGEIVNILIKNNLLPNEYKKIVDFRNFIVHGYFGIDYNIVWDVINKKIPILNEDIIKIIKNNKIDLSETINECIKDYFHQKETVKFLNKLKEQV